MYAQSIQHTTTNHARQGMIKDATMITQEFVEILACPKCKGPVELQADQTALLCRSCRLLYPIREDIPIMLIDEAKPLPPEQ